MQSNISISDDIPTTGPTAYIKGVNFIVNFQGILENVNCTAVFKLKHRRFI